MLLYLNRMLGRRGGKIIIGRGTLIVTKKNIYFREDNRAINRR